MKVLILIITLIFNTMFALTLDSKVSLINAFAAGISFMSLLAVSNE